MSAKRGPDEILAQVQRVTRLLGLDQTLEGNGLTLVALILLIQRMEALEHRLDDLIRQLGSPGGS